MPGDQSRLELAPGHAGLTDDGLKCTRTQFGMVRDWHGERCIRESLLHHDMTSALTHLKETVACKDGADLFAGKGEKLTQ